MKLCIEKVNAWLLKHYQLGIVLLMISGIFGYVRIPAVFFPQKTGVVENIEETTERFTKGGPKGIRRDYELDILIFTIDGEKYIATKTEENSDGLLGLLGHVVTVRFSTMGGEKSVREVVYDGRIIADNKDYKSRKFIFWFTLFILSLSWCCWALVLKWRSVP